MALSEGNLQFEHLGRGEGLPSDIISTIFEDSYGFMWFGTEDGLVRYDGYEMKIYKNDPNDPNSLSNSSITSLFEDRSGVLWIGTTIGLNRFDRSTETFKKYFNHPNDSLTLSHNFIHVIHEDQQGLFWIGTHERGLNLMDREKETFVHYLPDPDYKYGFTSNAITTIVEDAEQVDLLWLGTIMNINRTVQFNTSSREFIYYPDHIAEKPPGYLRKINSIAKSSAGEIWLGTDQGLDRFVLESKAFNTYKHQSDNSLSLSQNSVTVVFEDTDHNLWVGTNSGGLNKFNKTSQTFHPYHHSPYDSKSLASDRISAILEDRSGMLWIGTTNAGVSFANRKTQQFKHIKPYISNKSQKVLNHSVSAIYEDRTNVRWIGTVNDGIIALDEKTNKFRHFKDEPGDLNLLSKLWAWSILEDEQGILWFGSNRDGLYRYDREKETVKTYKNNPGDPNSLVSNYVIGIRERDKETLWVATYDGLQQMDKETEIFRTINFFEEGAQRRLIGCLYEDRAKNLWTGTSSGLYCLNQDMAVTRHFSHEEKDLNSLSSNVIYSIVEDKVGNIWIGTIKGLNKISFPATNIPKIKRYTETDGLPNNEILGLLEDDRGQLWISTNNGLSLFRNPQHDELSSPDFKNFDVKDGLQDYRFNNTAIFKNHKGEMFFGGNGGFNHFHPDSIQDNAYVPPIVITSFEFFDLDTPDQEAVSVKGITEKKELTISYKNNIFSISFAALSYREGHKNKYAYQLEGFNDYWIQLGTEHQVTFTNLDPGTYIFRVKGTNNDGIWNENPAELKIIITPPWWKTWWAYSLYILGILFAAYTWRNYELNRRELKHKLEIRQVEAEKLQQLDQMKSRFFANISHEFRTPLTLILGPLENFISRATKKEDISEFSLMKRNAQRLLRLINQLLALSRLEAGKLKLEMHYGDIVPFIRTNFYAFESLAESKGISLKFETKAEKIRLYFDPDKLEQIITNVLSNAFKFTPEGGVVGLKMKSVFEENVAARLEILVSDTGVGIPEAHLPHVFDRFYQSKDTYYKDGEGSGIGLALVKELVELHQGQIKVESKVGEGTEFTILLPIEKRATEVESNVEEMASKTLPQTQPLPLYDSSHPVLADQTEAADQPIVLLVEDNTDMRAFIHNQLTPAYQVIEAADGQKGMEKAIEFIPDLIISDVMMPRMDGLQLCDIIKKDERTSHIPIILLTAKADVESRLAGLERGADVYLAKPFNRQELLVHAQNLLELRRRLRERYVSLQPPVPAENKDLQIEDAFLQKARQIVEQHLSDIDFDMERFARLVTMSRSQLFRKIKALTGKSPSVFIRSIRLNRAKELLETTDLKISEVAYDVGFSTPAYFSDAFLETFGIRPSEVRQ